MSILGLQVGIQAVNEQLKKKRERSDRKSTRKWKLRFKLGSWHVVKRLSWHCRRCERWEKHHVCEFSWLQLWVTIEGLVNCSSFLQAPKSKYGGVSQELVAVWEAPSFEFLSTTFLTSQCDFKLIWIVSYAAESSKLRFLSTQSLLSSFASERLAQEQAHLIQSWTVSRISGCFVETTVFISVYMIHMYTSLNKNVQS